MSMLTRDLSTASPALRGPGQPTAAQAGVPGPSDRTASPAPGRSGEAPVADQPVAEARSAEKPPPSAVAALPIGEQHGGGLAALRQRAQLAQTQLGHQPLPIANQSSRLIMKLLGG